VFLSLMSDDIVTDSVTHVVVPNDNTRLTLKLLSGAVKGKWIVPVAYVTVCLESKQWMDEAEYGIRYDVPPLRGKKCFVGVSERHRASAVALVEWGGGEIVASTLRADVSITDWAKFTQSLIKGKLTSENT